MKNLTCLFVFILVLNACAYQSKSEPAGLDANSAGGNQAEIAASGSGVEEIQINDEIRKVDFKNFTNPTAPRRAVNGKPLRSL